MTISQVVAMDGGKTSLEQQHAAFKKLQQEKWKLQREIDNAEWQLWWLNWQIKFKNIQMQLRLFPAYYTKRAVGMCVIIAIAAVVYRVYHTADETDEPHEHDDVAGDTKEVTG
jgi:hypothetical protein